jgi:hypothetical protein
MHAEVKEIKKTVPDRLWIVDIGVGIPGFWLIRDSEGIWRPEPNQITERRNDRLGSPCGADVKSALCP